MKNKRSEKGQALAEGTVGIIMVTLFGFMALIFLLDAAMTIYYQLKLQTVTSNAAHFAANLDPGDPKIEPKTTEFVNRQLSQFNLPPASAVTVTPDNLVTYVSVKVPGLPLFGKIAYLPSLISLQDTELATAGEQVVGYIQLEVDNDQYNAFISKYPTMTPNPAFVPILACGQVPVNARYMLDSNNWPATHCDYHGVFPNFPDYRRGFVDPTASVTRFDQVFTSDDPAVQEVISKIVWPFPCMNQYLCAPHIKTEAICPAHTASKHIAYPTPNPDLSYIDWYIKP